MGVFLPAVGEAWALATLGGELGPESGLLLEVSTRKQSINQIFIMPGYENHEGNRHII